MALNLRSLLVVIVLVFMVFGVTACGGSNSSTSSGGSSEDGNLGIHGMHGSPLMLPGQQIPLQQSVHIHESGDYPVIVQNPMSMTLECSGRVNYSFNQDGQIENGVCENQSVSLSIIGSGTMQFNLGQGADMGLELNI